MRTAGIVAAICGIVAVAYGAILLFNPGTVSRRDDLDFLAPKDPELIPAARGPWPKFEVDLQEFDFGMLEEGLEAARDFTIRNSGQGPLVVKPGPMTCECELRNLTARPIAAGESRVVTLVWKPHFMVEAFEKVIELRSNDPVTTMQRLTVRGRAVTRFMVHPNGDWNVGTVRELAPAEFLGLVLCPIKHDFKVLAVEAADPAVSAAFHPLTDQGRRIIGEGRDGYEIRLKVEPRMPVGQFAIPLKIHTDVPERRPDGSLGDPAVLAVRVTGRREGPLRIMGQAWMEEVQAVVLGTFDATQGRATRLALHVYVPDEFDFQFQGTEVDPNVLQIDIARDANFKGKGRRYFLSLAYPAGGPLMDRQLENAATVRLLTNHPEIPALEFRVTFNAR